MLSSSRLKSLDELLASSSPDELIWINGYVSAKINTPITPSIKKINLAYGTETGNAKALATKLATVARSKGVIAKLIGLDQYRVDDLSKEEHLFVVISTQGEGEPPLPAKKFYDYIHANELSLSKMKYSVLALGDTSYPLFCKTGEDVDAQFQKFGASRVVPIKKCDVDFEEDAHSWFDEVLSSLASGYSENTSLNNVGRSSALASESYSNASESNSINTFEIASPFIPVKSTATVSKKEGKKFYLGTITQNINLNDQGSLKETYHIELRANEDIAYEPGDTIGIVPRNREEIAQRIISLTGIQSDKIIVTPKKTATVEELLTLHLNICYLLSSTIKKYGAIIQQQIPDIRMDLIDLLRIYPVKNVEQFEEFITLLMPIAPRLYSVASSPLAHGTDSVHITVAKDHFLAQEEQRFGLCSEFLGDLPVNSLITFYVHKDKNFKLPADDKDIIMIGPGTGVAPFRSFLAEREMRAATGRNWFFFGEQHFISDFLYQSEIQTWLKTGVLTKLDLAFSRDQPHKIYVQDRMKAKAYELFTWIDSGASLYVSGTKDPMSKDVEETLLQIIEEQGCRNRAEATLYLDNMKKQHRYEKDVY